MGAKPGGGCAPRKSASVKRLLGFADLLLADIFYDDALMPLSLFLRVIGGKNIALGRLLAWRKQGRTGHSDADGRVSYALRRCEGLLFLGKGHAGTADHHTPLSS